MMRFASTVILSSSLAACAVTESDSIKTDGIWASMGVAAHGNGNTSVTASLFLGAPIPPVFVSLGEDDRLVAQRGNESETLDETQILTVVVHAASFEGANEGDEVSIAFERAIDDGAPDSFATLPAPFTLDATPAELSRAQDLTVTWTSAPASEEMHWRAQGPCIDMVEGPITGASVTIPGGTLKKPDDMATDGPCDVSIDIVRTRPGQLDPAFLGGSMSGSQIRTFTLYSTP